MNTKRGKNRKEEKKSKRKDILVSVYSEKSVRKEALLRRKKEKNVSNEAM